MTRLQEVPAALAARELPGEILATGLTGRVLALAPRAAWESAAASGRLKESDVDALAAETIESGVLNWRGPENHVLIVSANGSVMPLERARAFVDFIFETPSPALTLELVDDDGSAWSSAWFVFEYARRRAEWGGRTLTLVYRSGRPPTAQRRNYLRERGVPVRAEFRSDADPRKCGSFGATRARVIVGSGSRAPELWVDALSEAGYVGVEWVSSPNAPNAISAAGGTFARFNARAMERLLELGDKSGLCDEGALSLLKGRPWSVRGTDLMETLAYGPDGGVYSSEAGFALDLDGVGSIFRLGDVADLRFQDLPTRPLVQALIAVAASKDAQPFCAACVYRPFCGVPASVHFRDQRSLSGRLPDSPGCRSNMGVLDMIFSRLNMENILKKLDNWGVDISKLRDYNLDSIRR
jgi:hypothetical protein